MVVKLPPRVNARLELPHVPGPESTLPKLVRAHDNQIDRGSLIMTARPQKKLPATTPHFMLYSTT